MDCDTPSAGERGIRERALRRDSLSSPRGVRKLWKPSRGSVREKFRLGGLGSRDMDAPLQEPASRSRAPAVLDMKLSCAFPLSAAKMLEAGGEMVE
jgi:hypothetical protein